MLTHPPAQLAVKAQGCRQAEVACTQGLGHEACMHMNDQGRDAHMVHLPLLHATGLHAHPPAHPPPHLYTPTHTHTGARPPEAGSQYSSS